MTAVSHLANPPHFSEFDPQEIRPGVFGTTFYDHGETLFLRMELLTAENAKNWARFQEITGRMADASTGGILGRFVDLAGTKESPSYEPFKEMTGFTEEEHNALVAKAILRKNQTDGKIVTLLEKNSVGSSCMFSVHVPEERHYIAYITRNPHYSVPYAETLTLKNYIHAYSDILISIGSDFSKESFFHNRGISRNPYWVLEDRYAGFSMLLQGFTGAFAERYDPTKLCMKVRPIGSMQRILQKILLPGECSVINSDGSTTDITNLAHIYNFECQTDTIKVSALTRIYRTAMSSMNEYILRNQTKGCAYPIAC